MDSLLAKTPNPPYYAMIFSSVITDNQAGYHEMAQTMVQLAQQQAGFLGIESAREELGITVSYWQTLHDIKMWKQNSEHLVAQKLGRQQFYKNFIVRISKVEKSYGL